MKITQDNIKIELENNEEIDTFWNVIAFALDYQSICEKDGKLCMNKSELEMAHKLYDLTERKR